MNIFLKIFTVTAALVIFMVFYSVVGSRPPLARAQTSLPVGGIFLAGEYDIFTPIITPPPSPCDGLEVTVVGPKPGTFMFQPVLGVYSYFPETPEHISDNMKGMAEPASQCGIPSLVMFGSSAVPGFPE